MFGHPPYPPIRNIITSYPIHHLKYTRTYIASQKRNMANSAPNQRFLRLYDHQPDFIYGTAWKKDQTKKLVKEALTAGFRRVDTAAQPRHYQEALVGQALREAFAEGILTREELFVCSQTSYIWVC